MPRPPANRSNEYRLLYNPYQQAFLAARRQRLPDGSRAFHRLCLIAGRRGGKTLIGALAAAEEASAPNTLGWCVAPTFGDLEDYVVPAVFAVIPETFIADWHETRKNLYLKNKSMICFRSGEDPERMRGPGLHWLWLDECRKIGKRVWDTVRPALTEHRGVAWFTTTPNAYDWVYHTIYKLALPGPRQRAGYWATRYRTIDNPAISAEEIEDARETMDPLWFQQEYEAEFVQFEGAIYGDRLTACILETDAEIAEWIPEWPDVPTSLYTIIGLDPGADHPFAAVKVVVTVRGLLVIGEYARRVSSFADHAEAIKILSQGCGDIMYAMDRTAIQAQIELAQHGIYTSAAENAVVPGIQRVQSWLKTKRLGFVASRCPMLLEQLRAYRWADTDKPKTDERGNERPFKRDDDLPDALRYAVMAWPSLPDPPAPDTRRRIDSVPPESRWAWEREQRLSRQDDEDTLNWDHDLAPVGDFWS